MSEPSRTPRVWNAGSVEPLFVIEVVDFEGDRWTKSGKGWSRPGVDVVVTWDDLLHIAPLTEVLPEPAEAPTPDPQPISPEFFERLSKITEGVERGSERCYFEGCDAWITGSSDYCSTHAELYAPAPAVSPNAPEPEERTLIGWTVPDHIGWVETDGYVEMTCHQDTSTATTSVQNREWVVGFLEQHAHGGQVVEAARAETVTPAAPVVSSAPISTSAGKDTGEGGEAGTGEIRASLGTLIADGVRRVTGWYQLDDQDRLAAADEVLAAGWRPTAPVVAETPPASNITAKAELARLIAHLDAGPVTQWEPETCTNCERAGKAADVLLAAGWRPLAAASVEIDDEADAWYVRVLDEQVDHTTEAAPVNLDWTRDGRLIGIELLGPLRRELAPPIDALRAEIRAVLADPMLDEAMMLDQVNAIVEREPSTLLTAAAAMQRLADLTRAAGKTRTAPWIEVCAAEPDPSKWPPAPAYKGAVIHVEDEEKTPLDLASMPDEWLSRLTGLVVEETRRRGLPRVWLKAEELPDSETERRLHDHLVECGQDWTRVTRAAGLIADDVPDDVVAAIERMTAERDEIRVLIDKRENCVRKGYLPGDELWLTEAVREILDRARAAREDQRLGCCTACNGTGDAGGYPCEDCYATGHSHADDVSCDDRARAEREAKP